MLFKYFKERTSFRERAIVWLPLFSLLYFFMNKTTDFYFRRVTSPTHLRFIRRIKKTSFKNVRKVPFNIFRLLAISRLAFHIMRI